jgi:hypothetical protein
VCGSECVSARMPAGGTAPSLTAVLVTSPTAPPVWHERHYCNTHQRFGALLEPPIHAAVWPPGIQPKLHQVACYCCCYNSVSEGGGGTRSHTGQSHTARSMCWGRCLRCGRLSAPRQAPYTLQCSLHQTQHPPAFPVVCEVSRCPASRGDTQHRHRSSRSA